MSAYFVLSAATNLGLITSSASFLHATDKKKGERKTRRTKLSAKGCRNVIFRLTDQSPARFTDLWPTGGLHVGEFRQLPITIGQRQGRIYDVSGHTPLLSSSWSDLLGRMCICVCVGELIKPPRAEKKRGTLKEPAVQACPTVLPFVKRIWRFVHTFSRSS